VVSLASSDKLGPMKRRLAARQSRTFRKLRKIAGVSLEQLASDSGVDVQRLRSFELNRVRLREQETARVLQTLLRLAAAKLGTFDPASDAAADRADELTRRFLEQTADLDVAALVPLPTCCG
jgi:transcriptional regulator with XRE-family HTH domain